MARNYSYTINIGSRFNPLSYEEIIKPLLEQTELLNQYEDIYAELSSLAETIKQRALVEPDSEWAKRYNAYAENLLKSADELVLYGLNVSSRALVNQARRNYARDIVPIQQAIAKQAEFAKAALSANPSLRMQYENIPTIDLLIADPTISQRSYSGADVEKSAMQLAQAASTRKTSDSFNQFADYWIRHHESSGYNLEDVNEFLSDAQSVPELRDIIYTVSSQFDNFEGLSDTQKHIMASEIMSGILKGATYKENNQYQLNPILMDLLKQSSKNKQTREEALGFINPMNIYGLNQIDKETKKHVKFSKYFDENGQITNEGYAEYLKKGNFYDYMNNLNNGNVISSTPTLGISASDKFNKLFGNKTSELQNAGKLYDATKFTEYQFALEGSQRDDWKSAILAAYSNIKDIPIVDFDSENKKYGLKGKESISRTDLASKDYTVIDTRMSVYGNVATILDIEGNTFKIELPAGINPVNEHNRDMALKEAEYWLKAIITASSEGYYRDSSGKIWNITEPQLKILQQKYEDALLKAYQYHSQLGVYNKVKPNEYNPFGY